MVEHISKQSNCVKRTFYTIITRNKEESNFIKVICNHIVVPATTHSRIKIKILIFIIMHYIERTYKIQCIHISHIKK